jgi:hypothetical protein
MDFKLNDLKVILPVVQKTKGDDFIRQIGQVVDDSANLKQLETGINDLFNKNDLSYVQDVANFSTLKAGETDSMIDRITDGDPIQNELIKVIEKIDEKAKEFDQTSENSDSGKE